MTTPEQVVLKLEGKLLAYTLTVSFRNGEKLTFQSKDVFRQDNGRLKIGYDDSVFFARMEDVIWFRSEDNSL